MNMIFLMITSKSCFEAIIRLSLKMCVGITVMSHERQVIWNHLHLNCLFQQLVQTINKENIKALHYWAFVRGIHWSPVDSPHKGPVMQKTRPCHDIIMDHRVPVHDKIPQPPDPPLLVPDKFPQPLRSTQIPDQGSLSWYFCCNSTKLLGSLHGLVQY